MPRAPPSSELVSDAAEAAPARDAGAEPTAMSVTSVTTTPSRRAPTAAPATGGGRDPPACPTARYPSAPTARPPATSVALDRRGGRRGASVEPAMKPSASGTVHRPATSGERPTTDWRYW